MLWHKNQKKQSGFTLIELLVTITLISIFAVTYLNAYTANILISKYTRQKTIAASIAQEKMETIKNMPYEEIATLNGNPSGTLLDNETLVRSNYTFNIATKIIYFDDPYDGCYAYISPSQSRCTDGSIVDKAQDLVVNDYKKLTVQVFNQDNSKQLAETSTSMASHAAETSTNTGILAVRVQDANSNNIPYATITITSTLLANPIVQQSSENEITLFSGLPPGQNAYHVQVEKTGYSSTQTYPITVQNPQPENPDASILIQQVTDVTLSIDLVSSLEIHTVGEDGVTPIGNQSLTITTTESIANDRYIPKNTITNSTDGNGILTLSNLEWGGYNITASNIYILSANPYLPIQIPPDDAKTIILKLSSDANKMRITTLSPNATIAGGTVNFVITGENLIGINSIILSKSGQNDIVATNYSAALDGKDADFDASFLPDEYGLQGLIGFWDLKLIKGAEILIQNNALQIN